MTSEQFFTRACDHAERGGRIKVTYPDGKKRNLWPGQGNISGLYGEYLYEARGGKWKKSANRFVVKFSAAMDQPGVLFELQNGYSPDRIRMVYHTICTWMST
jgi:hypothetical protein